MVQIRRSAVSTALALCFLVLALPGLSAAEAADSEALLSLMHISEPTRPY